MQKYLEKKAKKIGVLIDLVKRSQKHVFDGYQSVVLEMMSNKPEEQEIVRNAFSSIISFNQLEIELSMRLMDPEQIKACAENIKVSMNDASNAEALKTKYYSLLAEKDITYTELLSQSGLRRDALSKFINNKAGGIDILFRIIFAMRMTTEEAKEFAALSRHPLNFIDDRELILFGCVDNSLYNIYEVDQILNYFHEEPLAGGDEEEEIPCTFCGKLRNRLSYKCAFCGKVGW